MSNKIAIIMKDKELIASFFKADKIVIFDKGECVWKRLSEVCIPDNMKTGAAGLRAGMVNIIKAMGDCRIVAGGKIVGVPYTELERYGFNIFEIDEYGDDVFDAILEDIEHDESKTALKEKIVKEARPVETSTPGVYYLDLVALQTECPEVSSKQAMKEFFESTPFVELQLVCNHIPPWLDGMCMDIKESKTADGKFRAIITKKQCR